MDFDDTNIQYLNKFKGIGKKFVKINETKVNYNGDSITDVSSISKFYLFNFFHLFNLNYLFN